jgi:hypothetical protein
LVSLSNGRSRITRLELNVTVKVTCAVAPAIGVARRAATKSRAPSGTSENVTGLVDSPPTNSSFEGPNERILYWPASTPFTTAFTCFVHSVSLRWLGGPGPCVAFSIKHVEVAN